ncbi:MAG: dCTP deaminase [Alphaproteobacteria bacterium]|nr:dCTP deaminase [Alphaproteobacteria bacterium]
MRARISDTMLSGEIIKLELTIPRLGNPDSKPNLIIKPYDEKHVSTRSYDIHLGDKLLVFKWGLLERFCNLVCPSKIAIDPTTFPNPQPVRIKEIDISKKPFVLKPGRFALGTTLEYFEVYNHALQIDGTSKLARSGLSNHQTAGWTDVGFCGEITLEFSTSYPIKLSHGMKIGQISCHPVSEQHNNYKGTFRGQTGPTLPWTLKQVQR